MKNGQYSADPSDYLKTMLQIGDGAMQDFQNLATSVAGTNDRASLEVLKESTNYIVSLQQWYIHHLLRFFTSPFDVLMPRSPAATLPVGGDRRFNDEAWREPYYELLKQSYQSYSRQMLEFVENAQVDSRTKLQLRFCARQYIDAISPSNFAVSNPEVIRRAMKTGASSLRKGMMNLLEDVQKGRITRVDEKAFEVGGNLAVTPGVVVFQNDLIQLIQYTPQTETVEQTPLLIVPPCINKYYVLDLGAGNSFVEYAVAQGHQVFLISWRSAVPEIGHLTWDDYLETGVLKAIEIVLAITQSRQTHALGFCVGGTILSCAAAVLAGRGQNPLATITLLTTLLDFADPGEIGLLIDEPSVAMREASIGKNGILPGKELAFTFGMLRANDLIWRYVVDSYLKGENLDAFDLLYWDSDSVSLPGPMYCWYARNGYIENNLKTPGRTLQCGIAVDFSSIKVPVYILASREDHIVPWKSAYMTRSLMGGETRFVLAASGHIAGVINPPKRNKRSHWLTDDPTLDSQRWLEAAAEQPGSWWPDWDQWMKARSNGVKTAAAQLGNDQYRPIEPAPGSYVKTKSN